MKTRFLISAAILTCGIASTSQAGVRSLIYDDVPADATTATSQTVNFADFAGFSFTVAPGVTSNSLFLGSGVNIGNTFYEINWSNAADTTQVGSLILQQVAFITPSLSDGTPNQITVDFNYAQPPSTTGGVCSAAAFSVGGFSFSSGNPCAAGGGNNEFKFSDAGGVLSLLSAPTKGTDATANWVETSSGSSGGSGGSSSGGTTSAPEIDPTSALTGVAVLLGSLAIMLGRSRQRTLSARRI